MFEGHKDPKDS